MLAAPSTNVARSDSMSIVETTRPQEPARATSAPKERPAPLAPLPPRTPASASAKRRADLDARRRVRPAVAAEGEALEVPEDDDEYISLTPSLGVNWGTGKAAESAYVRRSRRRMQLLAKPDHLITAEEWMELLFADDGPPPVFRLQGAPELTEDACLRAEAAGTAWREGRHAERTQHQAHLTYIRIMNDYLKKRGVNQETDQGHL